MNYRKTGLLITLLLLAGLVLLNRKEVQLDHQTDLEFHPIAASGYELISVIHLYNPNLLSSTITQIKERLIIKGEQVGELDNQTNQGIPGGKVSDFPVAIRFPSNSFHADSTNKVEVLLRGEITYRNLIGGGTLIINQKDSVYVKAL